MLAVFLLFGTEMSFRNFYLRNYLLQQPYDISNGVVIFNKTFLSFYIKTSGKNELVLTNTSTKMFLCV